VKCDYVREPTVCPNNSKLKVDDKIIGGLGFDNHIIDVSFDVATDLLVEAHLDDPLISCSGVLESEGHSFLTVGTEGRDE